GPRGALRYQRWASFHQFSQVPRPWSRRLQWFTVRDTRRPTADACWDQPLPVARRMVVGKAARFPCRRRKSGRFPCERSRSPPEHAARRRVGAGHAFERPSGRTQEAGVEGEDRAAGPPPALRPAADLAAGENPAPPDAEFCSIEEALAELRAGRMIVLVDDEE